MGGVTLPRDATREGVYLVVASSRSQRHRRAAFKHTQLRVEATDGPARTPHRVLRAGVPRAECRVLRFEWREWRSSL